MSRSIFPALHTASRAALWVLLVSLSPVAFAQVPAGSGAAPGTTATGDPAAAALPAEGTEPVDSVFPVEPFPLIPILQTIRAGEILWRPDWPVSMPPDAFTAGSSRPAEISLLLESASGDPPKEYLLRRGGDGFLTDFPVYLWGAFFQTALIFDARGRTGGFTIATPVPWTIEFLEYDDTLPSIARIGCGETWFFAVFQYNGAEASETWYGGDGAALAVFTFGYTQWDGKPLLRHASLTGLSGARTEACHYDSLGNLSAISNDGGEFSARYRRERPQYWERPSPELESPGLFALQWDERGFLVRLSSENSLPDGTAEPDLRYEYTQDEQNNWTERREVTMIRRFGYLVPYQGETIRRRITYFEPDADSGSGP